MSGRRAASSPLRAAIDGRGRRSSKARAAARRIVSFMSSSSGSRSRTAPAPAARSRAGIAATRTAGRASPIACRSRGASSGPAHDQSASRAEDWNVSGSSGRSSSSNGVACGVGVSRSHSNDADSNSSARPERRSARSFRARMTTSASLLLAASRNAGSASVPIPANCREARSRTAQLSLPKSRTSRAIRAPFSASGRHWPRTRRTPSAVGSTSYRLRVAAAESDSAAARQSGQPDQTASAAAPQNEARTIAIKRMSIFLSLALQTLLRFKKFRCTASRWRPSCPMPGIGRSFCDADSPDGLFASPP